MPVSAFELFKIGIGPSSSHTVGPMIAARRFLHEAEIGGVFDGIAEVTVELFGSLALTGRGHATDRAIFFGLLGEQPDTIQVDRTIAQVEEIRRNGRLPLLGRRPIEFDERTHLLFHQREKLPYHPNGLRFSARDSTGNIVYRRDYYSVGGGFVVAENEVSNPASRATNLPYPYRSAQELLAMAASSGLRIDETALANETVRRSVYEVRAGLDRVWSAMRASIDRGLHYEGELPGAFRVRRRAPGLYRRLNEGRGRNDSSRPLHELDWVAAFAIAVNEENAAGGRVVTAPTNGAAGIIPAVLGYYNGFYPIADRTEIHRFLLTAAAVGSLYKKNASISGAEVGCQGEVGVACSMAAAGLAAVLGASNEEIENAAEIGMEHNLGLTCDPVGGLVQIPCIERNAIGATNAITAAQLALSGDGRHHISLDKVIETMRQAGADMQTKNKETSLGGLAANVTLCRSDLPAAMVERAARSAIIVSPPFKAVCLVVRSLILGTMSTPIDKNDPLPGSWFFPRSSLCRSAA
ncbi:L-serine ammonia-lyase [Bradyrhizobium sp. CB82]|uniref:L-serine ammonia-lyase n=1 Tax=Bradyrhizobium sp. CB82 TaxID=3039159 RepID=UPI0024B11385|nr:L-serine ammonia-lyase [Bradyrhizobium sp. CB82]WFU39984.1 L-serine ammonia-lyase [Bradyrhizobium sp. CB82]